MRRWRNKSSFFAFNNNSKKVPIRAKERKYGSDKRIKTKSRKNSSKKGSSLILLILILFFAYYFYKIFETSENETIFHQNITPTPNLILLKTPEQRKCVDGTIYGSCSNNKPFFCDNGTLIKKPKFCGCPEKYVLYDDSCVYQLTLNPEIREFRYCLRGFEGKITVTLYGGLNNYLAELSKKVSCEEKMDLKMIENPDQLELIKELIELIEIVGVSKEDQVRIAISLVQKIPYDYYRLSKTNFLCTNGYLTNGTPPRFPYQVLYENKGVCSEKSRLLALLLKELGFGVVLLEYEAEKHMAVGIKCPKQYANYLYNDTGYCFVESTSPSIVTDNRGEYLGVGKLKSEPKIIFVSDGLSFESVYMEYNDAKEWLRINEIAERNNKVLSSSDYYKWEGLVRKYCIEFD